MRRDVVIASQASFLHVSDSLSPSNSVFFSIFIMITKHNIFATENFFYPQFCGHQTEVNILLHISCYLC